MKNICLFLIAILSLSYLSPVERHKPGPLSELQNKNSHNYVPIPYPKSRKDIIINLDYGLTQTYMGQYKEIISAQVGLSDEVSAQQLAEDYLSKAKGYRVGDIVKVYNKTFYKPYEFEYLIELLGPDGVPVLRAVMSPSGRCIGYVQVMERPWPLLKKQYSDDRQVLNLLNKVNVSKNELMESDYFDYYGISSVDNPAKKITTKDNKIYFVSNSHRVYRLLEIIKDRGDIALKEKMSKIRTNHTYNKESKTTVVHDTVDDQFLILEEIK